VASSRRQPSLRDGCELVNLARALCAANRRVVHGGSLTESERVADGRSSPHPWPKAAETSRGTAAARSLSFDAATLRRSRSAVNIGINAFVASASEVPVGLGGREATPRGDGSGPRRCWGLAHLPPTRDRECRARYSRERPYRGVRATSENGLADEACPLSQPRKPRHTVGIGSAICLLALGQARVHLRTVLRALTAPLKGSLLSSAFLG
jgi:hypothetical protein